MKNEYGFEVDMTFGGKRPVGRVTAVSDMAKSEPVQRTDKEALLTIKAYLEDRLAEVKSLLAKM